MQIYQTKARKLAGTDFNEVREEATILFKKIKSKSRRQPYVRSAFFKKEKVFLNLFWQHLFDQNQWRTRMKRLQYFAATIELIQCSRNMPTIKNNPNKKKEVFYRFTGRTKDGSIFYVQIKENISTQKKFLMSCFPAK